MIWMWPFLLCGLPCGSVVKNLPTNARDTGLKIQGIFPDQGSNPGLDQVSQEDPLEKEIVTHFHSLEIPRTEDLGGL